MNSSRPATIDIHTPTGRSQPTADILRLAGWKGPPSHRTMQPTLHAHPPGAQPGGIFSCFLGRSGTLEWYFVGEPTHPPQGGLTAGRQGGLRQAGRGLTAGRLTLQCSSSSLAVTDWPAPVLRHAAVHMLQYKCCSTHGSTIYLVCVQILLV